MDGLVCVGIWCVCVGGGGSGWMGGGVYEWVGVWREVN